MTVHTPSHSNSRTAELNNLLLPCKVVALTNLDNFRTKCLTGTSGVIKLNVIISTGRLGSIADRPVNPFRNLLGNKHLVKKL